MSRLSRVPNANASTPRPEPTAACRNSSSARVYRAIDPETSHSRTSLRGTDFRARKGRSTGSPPVRRERRTRRRMSRTSPRGSGYLRRDVRRGRAWAIAATSCFARWNSSGVISAKSFSRRISRVEAPSTIERPSADSLRSSAPGPERSSDSDRACRTGTPRRGGTTGERRNQARNARSKRSSSSWRETSVWRSVQYTSSCEVSSTASRPQSASCTRPGPTSSPASCSTRPKVTT